MAKDVDLLSYWMPILRNLKEFKEIANAEEPELELLLAEVDRTLNNMFIETADEEGIKHFEEMMGLYPKEGATLEERRFEAMVKWNDKLPYTEEALKGFLDVLCGKDGYSLTVNPNNYSVSVKLGVTSQNSADEVISLLDRIVPANLERGLILFNTHNTLSRFTHEYLSNYTYKSVREDIL